MEIILTKAPQGFLIPAMESEANKLLKFKAGATMRCEVSQMRNGKFFRKWWVLAKFAFDAWSESTPMQEYKGRRVLADFERFRRDLTVLAGCYRPVFAANGELRLEPESLQWAKMTEERFEALYSATINVILEKILPDGRFTEEQLRNLVEQTMGFA